MSDARLSKESQLNRVIEGLRALGDMRVQNLPEHVWERISSAINDPTTAALIGGPLGFRATTMKPSTLGRLDHMRAAIASMPDSEHMIMSPDALVKLLPSLLRAKAQPGTQLASMADAVVEPGTHLGSVAETWRRLGKDWDLAQRYSLRQALEGLDSSLGTSAMGRWANKPETIAQFNQILDQYRPPR